MPDAKASFINQGILDCRRVFWAEGNQVGLCSKSAGEENPN